MLAVWIGACNPGSMIHPRQGLQLCSGQSNLLAGRARSCRLCQRCQKAQSQSQSMRCYHLMRHSGLPAGRGIAFGSGSGSMKRASRNTALQAARFQGSPMLLDCSAGTQALQSPPAGPRIPLASCCQWRHGKQTFVSQGSH